MLWRDGKTSPEEVAEFLNQCINENILKEFIENNRAEVPEMIINDMKRREDLLFEEGRKEGIKENQREIIKLIKENPNLSLSELLALIEKLN